MIGMSDVEDIWAGTMVWVCVIVGALFVLIQFGFFFRWVFRLISNTPEEDLRAKNIPFSVGNIVRVVFNYLLLPIVALSTFQLVVAGQSQEFAVALAVITLIILICFAAWLLYLIFKTRPRAVLFDDLPTVLLYGPLYNTYSDEAAAFALIPVMLTFIRGITIGAVQPVGIAQIVILAICEVIYVLTLHAFRPFQSPTSMNAYHTLFSVLRFATVMLMVAFVPQMGVTEGPKGWIGYTILLIHACVLVLGFMLNALQTIIEVTARILGAGGDDTRGLQRGGLSKIFGMRQLQRRTSRRNNGPSRASQLSTTGMLDADEASKTGYVMRGGRLRNYSTREVDFYYGVRGPALNSEGVGRKLGTGPADPTGPMSSAAGWFRNFFGGKTKEKGKGFEVVRSSRMPPAMRAAADAEYDAEPPPEGIPVAMGVLRNGPIESDDDEPKNKATQKHADNMENAENSDNLLNDDGVSVVSSDSEIETKKLEKGFGHPPWTFTHAIVQPDSANVTHGASVWSV
ncbi:hypothetical protein K4K59_007893 [Colletotrichum sp. SAR11_240]|nr:hypothetical protein K4K59_007893 [Colletotrichum sp. SAR11_240]